MSETTSLTATSSYLDGVKINFRVTGNNFP